MEGEGRERGRKGLIDGRGERKGRKQEWERGRDGRKKKENEDYERNKEKAGKSIRGKETRLERSNKGELRLERRDWKGHWEGKLEKKRLKR